jgi:putative flavoprotein involved in K+ transport
MTMAQIERYETVIVGGGQAGLSVAYHLKKQGRSFVLLDASERIGDSWRNRWDSLRLYSPAFRDGLPGMPFPAPRSTYPTKDEMGDYLEAYAARFELPVRSGTAVETLTMEGGRYSANAGNERFEADNVVVATGVFKKPYTPELSGTDTGQIPVPIESRRGRLGFRVLVFAGTHLLNADTPMGRKMRPHVRHGGGPLLRYRRKDLLAAGVERVIGRTAGVKRGLPVLDDGRVVDVRNVVWCTGFRPDFSWIRVPFESGADGYPVQYRGAVASSPGLYFTGLPFLHSFASMLIAGSARDAERVARHIVEKRTPRRQAKPDEVALATAS